MRKACLIVAVLLTAVGAACNTQPSDGEGATAKATGATSVDLCVADTQGLARPGLAAVTAPVKRPGVLIAWRNTDKVLEVESQICNRGTKAAQAEITMAVIDPRSGETRQPLDRGKPFIVTVPGAADGGSAGITVQVPGRPELNQLFDELDRADHPYCVRVSAASVGTRDANVTDNSATKCYNQAAALQPGGTTVHQFTYRNTGREPVTAVFDSGADLGHVPAGWKVTSEPASGKRLTLKPGERLTGFVQVFAPKSAREGDYADLRPRLVAERSGAVIGSSELFAAVDTRAPEVVEAFVENGSKPGLVYLNVRAKDAASGVAEASGATAVFSTDGGLTKTVRTMAYSDGNFMSPTGFDTEIGPFPPGTELQLSIALSDVAGNHAETAPQLVRIPLEGRIALS